MERQRHPGTMVLVARPLPDFASLNPGYKAHAFLRSRAFPIHATLVDIFLAIHRRDVRRIAVEIGSPDPILRPLLVDPLPQQVGCNPSLSTRRALGAHDIGGESVAIAAAPAAAMVGAVGCRFLAAGDRLPI